MKIKFNSDDDLPLMLELRIMTIAARYFFHDDSKYYDGETKLMHFMIEFDGLFKKYNNIWNKVSINMEKDFDSRLVCSKKFLKTKVKS